MTASLIDLMGQGQGIQPLSVTAGHILWNFLPSLLASEQTQDGTRIHIQIHTHFRSQPLCLETIVNHARAALGQHQNRRFSGRRTFSPMVYW